MYVVGGRSFETDESKNLANCLVDLLIDVLILHDKVRLLKILLPIFLLFWTIPFETMAQIAQRQPGMSYRGDARSNGGDEGDVETEDPCIQKSDERYCWTQDPITGIHYDQVPDTSHIGLANRQTMAGKSLGLVHTGNLFAPHYLRPGRGIPL